MTVFHHFDAEWTEPASKKRAQCSARRTTGRPSSSALRGAGPAGHNYPDERSTEC